MKHIPFRWAPPALWIALLAWGLIERGAGSMSPDPSRAVPCQLDVADNAPDLPAPVSVPALGPGKTAPAQDRWAQPTLNSSPDDPTPSAAPGKQWLTQAAARLDAQDYDSAVIYLQRYLRENPDATVIRLQLAELYFRLQRWEESRHQFDTALSLADDAIAVPVRFLIHGHSRLLDLAEREDNTFEQALHRGIGLVLLAEKRSNEGTAAQEVTPVELFARARTALQSASQCRPTDCRPHLYLVSVWLGLQQFSNAHLALARAQSLAVLSCVSPAESARLARWSVELRPPGH